MKDAEIIYSGYTIRIVPQPKRGDYVEVFFRAFKDFNENTGFVLHQKISGTSGRKRTEEKNFIYLTKIGLENVKKIIDHQNYIDGQSFLFSE